MSHALETPFSVELYPRTHSLTPFLCIRVLSESRQVEMSFVYSKCGKKCTTQYYLDQHRDAAKKNPSLCPSRQSNVLSFGPRAAPAALLNAAAPVAAAPLAEPNELLEDLLANAALPAVDAAPGAAAAGNELLSV